MLSTAFRKHIRENGVRLCIFDTLATICFNPNHDHLPGVYSTEAIQNAIIELLGALDAECPDVFLMLYWGYRSPWWLLHADTLFEPGLAIDDFRARLETDIETATGNLLDEAAQFDPPPPLQRVFKERFAAS